MLAAAVFELFARKPPPERGFLTAAGLEQVIQFLETIHFAADDLAWLRALILGYAVASLQVYRFAAVELVHSLYRARAISWVTAGGVVAGILGPAMAAR